MRLPMDVRVFLGEQRRRSPEKDNRTVYGLLVGDRSLRPDRGHHVRRLGALELPGQHLLLCYQFVQIGFWGPGARCEHRRLQSRQPDQVGDQLRLHRLRPGTSGDVLQPHAGGNPGEGEGGARGFHAVLGRHEDTLGGVVQQVSRH